MKNKTSLKALNFMLILCFCMSLILAPPVFAASVSDATINLNAPCSINIYKYDLTNASKDGVWTDSSYVSSGQYDENVNNILGNSTRIGDDDNISNLENGDTSAGYAIKGVEFTYLKVAEIVQFTESEKDGNIPYSHIEVLYKFDKVAAADLLTALGLPDGSKSYSNANALDSSAWFYQSDVLNKAVSDSLSDNSTTVKNALENFSINNGGTAMPLTDENGHTAANDLPVGLYLIVESKVPEMVTSSTVPFFISLPMTSVNGGGDDTDGNTNHVTNGGEQWLYDVVLYPKNETGIVTLEKTVRESQKDTGVHNGTSDINDGFKHNATASTNDTVEYQIISTLPSITSAATSISEYTFTDVLSRGITYDDTTPVVMEWFTDKNCTNKVATWNEVDNKFTYTRTKNDDGSSTMKIVMTDIGLQEINTPNTSANNVNGNLFAGYSNYTVRITYSAILNPDESLVYGDAGNPNTVVLTWKRTSSDFYDTLIDDCHIYSYAINLTKKFGDNATDQELFDKVLFKVYNKTDNYYVIAELNADEGIWYITGHTRDEAEATPIHPVDWNGLKGQIIIKGVEDNDYILTEIQTANEYTLLKDNLNISITSEVDPSRPCGIYADQAILGVIQNDPRYSFDGLKNLPLANIPQMPLAHDMHTASATVDGNPVTMLNDDVDVDSPNAIVPLTVVNKPGFDLPPTGENGTQLMTFVGVAITATAILGFSYLLISVLKKKNCQKDS